MNLVHLLQNRNLMTDKEKDVRLVIVGDSGTHQAPCHVWRAVL